MNNKILIVVDSINIEDSSGSKVNVAFIKNLVSEGFLVTVIHLSGSNIVLEGVKTVVVKENKYSFLYILSRTQRIIQRYTSLNLANILENKLGFSFTFFSETNALIKILKKYNIHDCALIITLSKGESFRPHYAVLHNPRLHDKWLAYVHDPYPFNNYPYPYGFDPKGKKQKEIFFKKVAQKSKFAAFPSSLLAKHMISAFSDFKKKSHIIPHQLETNNSQKINAPNFFDNLKFNLVHAGNLIGGRSPEGLVNGYIKFLNENPTAKDESQLILAGSHSYYKHFLNKMNKLPSITITNSIPYSEAVYLQNNASVNIILEGYGEFSPFLPGKFPQCVKANKIILALTPKISELRDLLGEDYFFKTEPLDSDKIAQLISVLYKYWKSDKAQLMLNRSDLNYYVSSSYLFKKINEIIETIDNGS